MRRTERKYSEEQIAALKKRLAALEEKDSGKTREEVVKDLEKSFRAAMRKGYSLKEISELCLQEEVFLPAGVLKKHLSKSSEKTIPAKRKKKEETQQEAPKNDVGRIFKAGRGVSLMSAIDFASMTNANNENDNSVFLDFSNHSKISDAVFPKAN